MGPKTSTPEIGRLAEMVRPWLAVCSRTGILAAVSGGPDSTAMLLALVELRRRGVLPGRLRVVHVDHGIRAGSETDAEFVRDLALSLDVPCSVHALADRATPPRDRESELRTARYDAFRTELRRSESRVLTTAHHADDVVETFLFRLRRGSGLRGLAGIPRTRKIVDSGGPSDSLGIVVRPLLDASREQLAAACASAGIEPRVDPTNADTTRARNQLRHRVVPALRARDPGIEARIRHACAIAHGVAEATDRRAQTWLADRIRLSEGVDQATFLRLTNQDDHAVRSEAFRSLHFSMLGADPSRAWLDRAHALADGPSGRRLSGRPPAIEIERTPGGMLWTTRGSVASNARPLHTLRPGAAPPSPPGS